MARYQSVVDRNLTKGFGEILLYTNEVTEGLISNLILLGIYIIVLFSINQSKRNLVEATGIAGFVTFVISVLLWLSEFIVGTTVVITLSMAILGFLGVVFIKRSV